MPVAFVIFRDRREVLRCGPAQSLRLIEENDGPQ